MKEELIKFVIEMYAPVILCHPDEKYTPKPVKIMLNHAALKQYNEKKIPVKIFTSPTIQLLKKCTGYGWFLEYYPSVLPSNLQSEYANLIYARIVRNSGFIFLQFHFFYAYNDWVNKHEGDWEMIQIAFSECELEQIAAEGISPSFATFSQHALGISKPWEKIEVWHQTHPVVYVGLGSHANYFEHRTYFQLVGFEKTGKTKIDYDIDIIKPEDMNGRLAWLLFSGKWGKPGTSDIFNQDGPVGPNFKLMWTNPATWSSGEFYDTGQPIGWFTKFLLTLIRH